MVYKNVALYWSPAKRHGK